MIISTLSIDSKADENDWFVYLGTQEAKKSPRRNINAAEALPPLPLPATPLRRTERKKPPQPDYLIGKVIWGESASFSDSTGNKMEIADWNLCPTDTEKFVARARAMDLQYHWQNTNLNDFHFDPKKLPALLFSGVRTLKLSDSHIQALRDYVLNGGMIICDSIAGSPYFYESAKKIFLRAFPESRFRTISPDHPLYHIIVDVDKVTYKGSKGQSMPFMEGIYIGSRVGVLVSKFGLGCGWNRSTDRLQKLKNAAYYDVKSANEIGVDLAAYIVGYAEVGLVEGRPEVFGLTDQARPTDEFVFAQIKHDGLWNVHPGAATALLMKLRRYTSVRVNLKRGGVVHVFSDLQEAEWTDEALQSESADDSINVILHRIESRTRRQANVAISSIQFPRQKILARHPLKIGVVCTNNSAAVAHIRVNSIDNRDKKSTQKAVLEPGRSQTVEVGISPDTPGYHWIKTWIEGDGFAADNQASIGIVCGQTATVLFAGSPSEFGVLPTAFSPDDYGQLTGMISKFTRSGQIPQAQHEKPILIVTTWEEIGQNNQASSGLRQYVEAGGNLLAVPSARRAGTNAPPPAWLGAGTKSRLSNARGIKIESMTKESGFWSRIREATGTASPENVTVFTYYPLELSEEFTSLLGIDFERVVFAHKELGRGNIYVSGTAFDPRWNTLPLTGLIVVMAQSIAVEGTALEEETMLSLVAGESPKGINASGQQVEITSLSGDETDFKSQAIDMPVFSKSGVYLVKAGDEEFCVSVRSSPKEGLTQFLKGSQVSLVSYDN